MRACTCDCGRKFGRGTQEQDLLLELGETETLSEKLQRGTCLGRLFCRLSSGRAIATSADRTGEASSQPSQFGRECRTLRVRRFAEVGICCRCAVHEREFSTAAETSY